MAFFPQTQGSKFMDPELGMGGDPLLVPGFSKTENALRWGFVRKVYGIISVQLLLTAIVAGSIASSPSTVAYLARSPGLLIGLMLMPLLGLIPLYCYRDRHPLNLALLGGWTLAMSASVGLVCSAYTPLVVIEAIAVTAGVVGGLTAYSFWATAKGKDLTFLGPFLFASLWGLIIWGFFQAFLPVGPLGRTIYSLVGALLFSGYIVFDTHLLIARFQIDEYIWASVTLYLDVINLFLRILQLLGNRND